MDGEAVGAEGVEEAGGGDALDENPSGGRPPPRDFLPPSLLMMMFDCDRHESNFFLEAYSHGCRRGFLSLMTDVRMNTTTRKHDIGCGRTDRSSIESALPIIKRNRESTAENPGNDLYVTGLSACITKRDLMELFSNEGKVVDVHLVTDPWSREYRRFGFVTMSSSDEAERCIKNLDSSVFEGRIITVEKARRRAPIPQEWYLESSEIHRCRHSSATRHSILPSTCGSSFSSYYKRETSRSVYYSSRSSCSHSSTLHHRSPVRRYYCDVSPDDRCHRRRYYRWMSCDDSRSPRARSDTGSCSPMRRDLRSHRSTRSRASSPGLVSQVFAWPKEQVKDHIFTWAKEQIV
ncbi:Serine/arginine-rich splicing factor SR45a-like protein [Drosera capensis]